MIRTLLCSQCSGPERRRILPDGRVHVIVDRLIGLKRKAPSLFSALVMATVVTNQVQAQTTPAKFVPFNEFVQSVRATDVSEFLARPAAAGVKVTGAASLAEMRQHVLTLYDGVAVSHSYIIGSQTFDCVPIHQQPSVRAFGLTKIADPPAADASKAPGDAARSSTSPKASQLPADRTTDDAGNALSCEDQTIPMSRITLDQLSHFSSLHEFFEKGPNGSGHAPEPAKFEPPATIQHKYAYAYQYVNNLGDNVNINLWRPYVYTDIGEIFTLAQSWTIGVSSGPVQTAEVGWQNYPARTGTQNPVLFIYWTADGYQNTGCYDLSCSAFVQVSNAVTIGGSFYPTSYSVSDGGQTEIQVEFYLYQGNWWLKVGGTWIGYYPGSLYKGGQLSRYSNLLEFGSESVGSTVWPGEGSGLFAESGWSYGAYQRLLYYVDTANNSYWDSLTPVKPSPACYSITSPSFDSNSGIYFYFGGPGGASCQ